MFGGQILIIVFPIDMTSQQLKADFQRKAHAPQFTAGHHMDLIPSSRMGGTTPSLKYDTKFSSSLSSLTFGGDRYNFLTQQLTPTQPFDREHGILLR